jgi:hypothetical protein
MAGPATGDGRPIESIRELRRLVPSIVERINADQALALRAAANPLLALDELGYRLAPSVRLEAERMVRFGKADREQLAVLEKEVFRLAGHVFELDDPKALADVLFIELQLSQPQKSAAEVRLHVWASAPTAPDKRPRTAPVRRVFDDPYAELAGKHPIVGPLLAYRQLDASQPPLAPRALYERIRRGEVRPPVVRLRARLKGEPSPGD